LTALPVSTLLEVSSPVGRHQACPCAAWWLSTLRSSADIFSVSTPLICCACVESHSGRPAWGPLVCLMENVK
ncbi:hypothetical protein K443DRAFT_92409, partial [Laccaria amethystina LaAM-08-1]